MNFASAAMTKDSHPEFSLNDAAIARFSSSASVPEILGFKRS